MDRLTARDPALRGGGSARAVRGAGAGSASRWRGTRPTGSAGRRTVLLPAVGEDVGDGAAGWRTRPGMPWFVLGLGSNILLPDEGLDALVVRLGKGLDRLRRRTATAGSWAPDCPRRSPRGGPPPPASPGSTSSSACPGTVGGGVYMNAGCHGGDWSEVVESVTVVDADGRDAVLPRARASRSPTAAAAWTAAWCWRRRSGSARGAAPAGRGDRRDVRVAAEGHAVQPALLRQRLQEPVGPSWKRKAARGPPGS